MAHVPHVDVPGHSILGKRRSPRVGRDDNLYVEGAHERTRQRSTPLKNKGYRWATDARNFALGLTL
jgi:hypothetical protein